jgi:hypothetical protein
MPTSHGLDSRRGHLAGERKVKARASVEKRRLARSLGIKPSDLDAVGRARFDGFSRAHAIVDLAEKWMSENPDKVISEDGNVAQIIDIYLRSLNTRRYELDKLEEFIREDLKSPEQEMRELLAKSDH